MTEKLSIDIIEDSQDPLPDYLKSPDRTKSWKGSRLRRTKTYSGSPNNRLGNENTQAMANKIIDAEKPIPLSPVNQRKGKWNKTNMKRRSTITARDKVNKSFNDRNDSGLIGSDCFALSTTKVEVRHSSDISKNAVMHRYSCQCKQYLDESKGIIYKLQEHQSFDSNLFEEHDAKLCSEKEKPLTPLDILNTSILEEDVSQIRSSTPLNSDERIQTYAENTRAETITEVSEFNFDFQLLDDTILELQTIQGQLRESRIRELWSDCDERSCRDQKSIDRRRIPSTIRDSMTETDGSSVVYLLISVFSYLDLCSVYEAGKVCRTWHCASQHPAVWRNVTIKNKKLQPQALHNLAVSCISTQQLRIENCTIEDNDSNREEIKNFYNSMSLSLKALYLVSNYDNNMLLDESIDTCTNVTRLHFDGKILDPQLDTISTNLTQLTCLNISNTRGLNPTQFYEIESVKCLTFNASGLRVDEIASIVDWFPNMRNLHIKNGTSLHSLHAKSVFCSVDKLLNLRLTDTYITPRALLFLLCTCRELKKVGVHFSPVFTVNNSFETNFLSTIQCIMEHALFKKILSVTFERPVKPARSSATRTHPPETG
ncbi:hypothetical protein ACHWQZ_G017252 [Mnemiopsis leidyi]